MDRIVLPRIPLKAHVGVTAEERRALQDVVVGLVLHLDLRPSGTTDDLSKTVDYDAVCGVVERTLGSRHFHLIETVAEEVARALLGDFDVSAVDVRVEKPDALLSRGVPFAAVEIYRARDA